MGMNRMRQMLIYVSLRTQRRYSVENVDEQNKGSVANVQFLLWEPRTAKNMLEYPYHIQWACGYRAHCSDQTDKCMEGKISNDIIGSGYVRHVSVRY